MGVTVHVCATGQYFLAGMFTHRKPSVYISPGAETLVVSHRALRSLDESSAAWVDARMAVIICCVFLGFFFLTTEINLAWFLFGPFFFFVFLLIQSSLLNF